MYANGFYQAEDSEDQSESASEFELDESEEAEESSDDENEFESDASEDSGSEEELDDSGEGMIWISFGRNY
jgi:hypothetical protein